MNAREDFIPVLRPTNYLQQNLNKESIIGKDEKEEEEKSLPGYKGK